MSDDIAQKIPEIVGDKLISDFISNLNSNFDYLNGKTNNISSGQISNNTITTDTIDKINDGAITTDKIVNNTITTDTIEKIEDNAITTNKINGVKQENLGINLQDYLIKARVTNILPNGTYTGENKMLILYYDDTMSERSNTTT